MILTDTADDLRSLREVTRDFFAAVAPHDRVDEVARVDRKLWSRACQQLGMAAVDVPEALGGLGLGLAALGVVLEEAGRVLAPLPLLGSIVLAQEALVASGDEETVDELMPGLLSGDVVAALAERHHPGEAALPVGAVRDSIGWRLTGTRWAVLDGSSADVLVVVGDSGTGHSIFLVDANGAGVTREPNRSIDLTRDFATVSLDAAPARMLGAEGGWPAIEARLRPRRTFALACEALGSAQACLDRAVEYARTRVQFGRPIGSFQAIKHRCADLAVELDDARSAVDHAMWCTEQATTSFPLAAAIAGAATTQAHLRATADSIHVHGGIGFTWEHTAHLHFRRAHSNAALFGGVREHREEVLLEMGI